MCKKVKLKIRSLRLSAALKLRWSKQNYCNTRECIYNSSFQTSLGLKICGGGVETYRTSTPQVLRPCYKKPVYHELLKYMPSHRNVSFWSTQKLSVKLWFSEIFRGNQNKTSGRIGLENFYWKIFWKVCLKNFPKFTIYHDPGAREPTKIFFKWKNLSVIMDLLTRLFSFMQEAKYQFYKISEKTQCSRIRKFGQPVIFDQLILSSRKKMITVIHLARMQNFTKN